MLNFILVLINSGVVRRNIGYLVLTLYEIFFLQLATKGKIVINSIAKSPVWLLAFSGLIYGISRNALGERLVPSLIVFCIMPVLIFIAGYTITDRKDGKNIQSIEKCLYAIALGCAIHVVLNIFANSDITSRSETVDFFVGRLAATNLGSLNTFILALLPCLIITKKRTIRIVGFIIFALTVIYAFILGTRTTVYALAIMTVISFFVYVRMHCQHGIKINTLLKWCCVSFVIVVIAYVILKTDFLAIRTKIETSTLTLRYKNKTTHASDSVRLKVFQEGIKNLFAHPMGGNKTNGINYFHNYWLDVGRIAGVIPVIMLIIMDMILIIHMWKLFNNKSIDEDLRYAIFGIYVCVFLNFFFEPIMDGYLDLFYRFTLINGLVEGLYDSLSYKKDRIYC